MRGGDESTVLISGGDRFRLPAYAQGAALVVASAPALSLEEAYGTFAEGLAGGPSRRALERAARDKAFTRSPRAERFALRGFLGAEPTFPGEAARRTLEEAIGRITGLRADSARPDLDLSVTLRADGTAYLLAPLKTGKAGADRSPGALPSHTARLLCELSRPQAEDVFLDPFMGSGAIPLDRSLGHPYRMIFAGDREEALVAAFKERLKTEERFARRRRTIFPKVLDATDLSRFQDGFFTAIVTDPPWGDWEGLSEEEVVRLYGAFLTEAARVTVPEARLVLLTGRTGALEGALDAAGRPWREEEAYQILVSGKKARALLLIKP